MSDATGKAMPLPKAKPLPFPNGRERRLPDGRFPPGHSGNPTGRPPGVRSRATLAVESAMSTDAEAIVRKVIELALAGNATAMRLCVERIAPRPRSRLMQIDLPDVNEPAGVAKAVSAILSAAANGEIDAEQARALANVLEIKRKNFETQHLEQRLNALEKKLNG